MLANIKGFFTGVLATTVVVFGAATTLGNSGQGEPPRTLGESCKDLKVIAQGAPSVVKMYVVSEAKALKMEPEFYLDWCTRLDK